MHRRRASLSAALLLLALAVGTVRAEDAPPEPEAYRLDDYRTPTPLTVLGHKALDTEEAERLWRAGAATFIDVLPAPRRPGNLPPTAIWAPRPRLSIPGSVWLPDVGRGALSPELEAWFRTALE